MDATLDDDKIVAAYRKAVAKGMLKVMAKMGISTLQSYKGAQIFEALGLQDEVVDKCFVGTASRIQGVSFDVIAEETLRRHALGFPERTSDKLRQLPNLGEFHWRAEGEKHTWSPESISSLQLAARNNDEDAYWKFAHTINEDNRNRCTLRGLLEFDESEDESISLNDVQPASEIVKRFCTGAMSFGSISAESHETLAIAMNRLGGKATPGKGERIRNAFFHLRTATPSDPRSSRSLPAGLA